MRLGGCLPAGATVARLKRKRGWVWGVCKVSMEFNKLVFQAAADADILARLRKISQMMIAILALFQALSDKTSLRRSGLFRSLSV